MNETQSIEQILEAIWERRRLQIINDIEEMQAKYEMEDIDESIRWNQCAETLHQLLGVFGILQFKDIFKICEGINEIIHTRDNRPDDEFLSLLKSETIRLLDAVIQKNTQPVNDLNTDSKIVVE
jgi:hypothetical protein